MCLFLYKFIIVSQSNDMKNIFNKIKEFFRSINKKWKKRYYPIIGSLFLTFLISIIIICLTPSTKDLSTIQPNTSESGWPKQIIAPYTDMTGWVSLDNEYSYNGVTNLGKIMDDTNIKYFNLGFINPSTTKPLNNDGSINWCWGGYNELSEKNNDGFQYEGIKHAINSVRDKGGDICISIGGQVGKAPWVISQDVQKLTNMYLDIINTYNLKRMDLDIEESNQDSHQNIINAQAIKAVQDQTGIEITLTIPIMPSGWENKQIKILHAYIGQDVDISLINSMTMCYGGGLLSGEDYGSASVRAIENCVNQLIELYAYYGKSLTKEQAYLMTGATVDIGYESSLYPIFTTDMTKKVVDHAKKNRYGMISYWSINRDAKIESNTGVNNKFDFIKELKKFNK